MFFRNDVIAKKYAKAFLNIYFDAMTPETVDAFERLAPFFKERKGMLLYLTIPTVSDQQRKQLLARFFADCGLIPAIQRLSITLLKQRRIELLPLVLDNIVQEYRVRNRVLRFDVSSSHGLNEQEKADIIAFLTRQTGGKIEAQFRVDESLLCGIRMQSRSFIFEQSVAFELKKIEQALLQRVSL